MQLKSKLIFKFFNTSPIKLLRLCWRTHLLKCWKQFSLSKHWFKDQIWSQNEINIRNCIKYILYLWIFFKKLDYFIGILLTCRNYYITWLYSNKNKCIWCLILIKVSYQLIFSPFPSTAMDPVFIFVRQIRKWLFWRSQKCSRIKKII